jgi:3-oxoacyl-[acyl-carrier protein] reductase
MLPRVQLDASATCSSLAEMSMLEGKVAIVTGSAQGIGRATAERLAEHGAHVVISDLDGDLAQETASSLTGEHAVHVGDLTKGGVPEALVDTAIGTWGKLDIIVNSAGYTLDAPVHKMTDDAFRRMMDIHLVVPFQVVRAAAPHLREPAKAERDRGEEVFRKIVNVSSSSGTMGSAGQANYSSAKAGLLGLTKTLAKEWGQFKINCNAVAFGFVETRLIAENDGANAIEVDGERFPLGIPPQLRAMAPTIVPLGRSATPREAAGGILFLCSPWSDYVHGQTLSVTGGLVGGMCS